MIGVGVSISKTKRLLASTSEFAFGGFEPAYLLDFVNDPAGAESALTFSRASTAMMRNSSGEWVSVGINEPRIGHHEWNGSEWVNKGLLVEEQATNLFDYWNDFAPDWSNGANAQPAAQTAIGPFGQPNSAWTFNATDVGGVGEISLYRSFALGLSKTYTLSLYVKSNGTDFLKIGSVNYTIPGNGGVFFNLSTSSVGVEDSGYVGAIEDMGNGWQRCSVTFTTGSSDSSGVIVLWKVDSDGQAVGSASRDGSGVLIYGAQLEEGSIPSSPIPTDGSAATRAADVMTQPAGTLPWSASALSLFMAGEVSGDSYTLLSWQVDASNRITHTLNTLDFTFTQAAAGTVDSITGGSHTSGLGVPFAYAATHTSTGIYAAVNGVALTPDETPTALADLTGAATSLLPSGNYTIAAIAGWAVDIGDTGRLEGSNYGA